jgi:hypothetical protein
MQHLDDIKEVGAGIAVAFVATIYGVALANILFLPAANKLKIKHRKHMLVKEMMLEGTLGILEGQNPRLIEGKLTSFLDEELQKLRENAKGQGRLMARKAPEHVNHERWLVSYADFIHIAVAFFVVMFAASNSDKKKAGQVAQSVQSAFTDLAIFTPSGKRFPVYDDGGVPSTATSVIGNMQSTFKNTGCDRCREGESKRPHHTR